MTTARTVLVVDDDEANSYVLRRYLMNYGASVLTATDGQEALDVLYANSSDVGMLLMDIAMPGMNGFALAKAIRSEPGYDHVALVALTARSGLEFQRQAEEVGIKEIISKPFDPTMLRTFLEQRGLITPK